MITGRDILNRNKTNKSADKISSKLAWDREREVTQSICMSIFIMLMVGGNHSFRPQTIDPCTSGHVVCTFPIDRPVNCYISLTHVQL